MPIVSKSSNEAVRVVGLKEFQKAIKAVDTDAAKELKNAFKQIADHVIGVAQQKMPFGSGEAAGSLKPRATTNGASITFPAGGRESWSGGHGETGAYYPWLDFGGTTGRGHSGTGHNTFGGSIHRPQVKGGRYLYPAIGESSDYIGDGVLSTYETIAKGQGFEVTE